MMSSPLQFKIKRSQAPKAETEDSVFRRRSASMQLMHQISRQPELLKLSDSAISIRNQEKSRQSQSSNSIESLVSPQNSERVNDWQGSDSNDDGQ